MLLLATGGKYTREPTIGFRETTISSAAEHTEPHFHTLHQQANGDIMEMGDMRDPNRNGEFSPYEAVWRVYRADPRVAVVLTLRGGMGLIVRVGWWCQGILRTANGEVTAERWSRKPNNALWERVHRVGKETLACGVACMDRDEDLEAAEYQGGRYWREALGTGIAFEKVVEKGDMVRVAGREWEVVERSQW